MDGLSYPYNIDFILKNHNNIINELRKKPNLIPKRIAILSESSTEEIKTILKVFLLKYGFDPIFFESDQNDFYKFSTINNNLKNSKLEIFDPDIIYIHTTVRNINAFPDLCTANVKELLDKEYKKYHDVWEILSKKYSALIIQNNFEYPDSRNLGNMDAVDYRGKINFINALNQRFYDYSRLHKNFFINDINYLAAQIGLDTWHNNNLWYNFKYALDFKAIPYLADSISSIVKSYYGRNKRALVFDLDGTLWGGNIGEDGIDNIDIGLNSVNGLIYHDFQKYIKHLKSRGVILNICSKNTYRNVVNGFRNPGSVLKLSDFIIVKSNMDAKEMNIMRLSQELDVKIDDMVFVDDSEIERSLVGDYIPNLEISKLGEPYNFIRVLDHNYYFEPTLSRNIINDTSKLKQLSARSRLMCNFDNYKDYLKSLKMRAEISNITSNEIDDVINLINSDYGFKTTNYHYTEEELLDIINNPEYITLYAKMSDVYGDNGLCSVFIGKIRSNCFHLVLATLSNNVYQRYLEYAMLDNIIIILRNLGINRMFCYYRQTMDNTICELFFDNAELKLIDIDEDGTKIYLGNVNSYIFRNNVIDIKK